jgi:hypothetical protein
MRRKGRDHPMADLYMHHKFALDVAQSINIPLDQSLLLLGAQGPDPFYFNVFVQKNTTSRRLADAMHEMHIDQLLSVMVTKAGESRDLLMLSFVIGFISHVILDQTIHPYVYHYSGHYQPKKPRVGHHRGLHMRFERRIDLVMIERDYQIKARSFPIYKKALPKVTIPEPILSLMDDLGKTVYDISGGGQDYARGYARMRSVIRFVAQDKTGLKRLLYKWIDLLNTKHELFLSDFSFAAPTGGIDYLNLGHHPWQHPVTGTKRTDSVLDMFDAAKERFKTLIKKLSVCLFDGMCSDVMSMIENRSLNSGIMLDQPQTMSHFSLFMDSNLCHDKDINTSK